MERGKTKGKSKKDNRWTLNIWLQSDLVTKRLRDEATGTPRRRATRRLTTHYSPTHYLKKIVVSERLFCFLFWSFKKGRKRERSASVVALRNKTIRIFLSVLLSWNKSTKNSRLTEISYGSLSLAKPRDPKLGACRRLRQGSLSAGPAHFASASASDKISECRGERTERRSD